MLVQGLGPSSLVVCCGSETSKTTSLNTGITAATVTSTSVGLLFLFVVIGICFCRKEPDEASSDEAPISPLHDDKQEGLGDTEFEQYKFKTLQIATRDFSEENMLGKGGFGIVYKGTYKNGKELAIKRLSQGTSGQDPTKRPLLDWITRTKIITGIARGFQYLHEDSLLTVIHRDLKPSNILLDMYMNPKIADFGLAKHSENEEKFGNTDRIAGTRGYMAPEYLMVGDYSDKTDVYSFGIMLLEIVSGRKNRIISKSTARQQEDFSIQAWRLWNEERSFEIIDPILLDTFPNNEVLRCIQIGLLFVQANAEERPTMTAVVFMLTCDVDHPLPSAQMMASNQYSDGQQSDIDRSLTKSITMTADVTDESYSIPR